jgi:hypothetical protein
MKRTGNRSSKLNRLYLLTAIGLTAVISFVFAPLPPSSLRALAQTTGEVEPTGIRVGERLTFNVAIGRYPNMAYAELYAVSRGRIADKDAIELRTKFKTLDLASATFYLIDETRTTFASPINGSPLYVSVTQNAFGLPKETITNFLTTPTPHFDLATMIYRIRQAGGPGSLTLQENEKVYSVNFQPGGVERKRTDAGEFDTTIVSVQSDYFSELGISDVRLNLSNDEARLPVAVEFRTQKGSVRATLASVQIIEPEVIAEPTPVPARTPVPDRTPKPVATPTPYIDNQPLAEALAFEIGERLEYRILSAGQQVASMRLAAKERIRVDDQDTLVLEASFSDVRPGSPFAGGDLLRAYVDPETLAPHRIEMRFAGELRSFSNTAEFSREGSVIRVGNDEPVDAPVGTHSILSLLYAARSFNLKPSRDLNNPINDTRVAVLWESRPHVFTLRPSPPEIITIDGKPVGAQMVAVTTKNPGLDRQNIKIWLGNDEARIPLRFSVGAFQAELISISKIPLK